MRIENNLFCLKDIGELLRIKNYNELTRVRKIIRIFIKQETTKGLQFLSFVRKEDFELLLNSSKKLSMIEKIEISDKYKLNIKPHNISNETMFVKKIKDILLNINPLIKIETQKLINGFLIDLYIENKNLCIEYNEIYHTIKKQTKKDIERKNKLIECGYNFLSIPFKEEDIYIGKLIKQYFL